MNSDPSASTILPRTPREEAAHLLNEYARIQALITAATAEPQAKIIHLTAALNEAAAPFKAKLEEIEARAKKLALEHADALFGEDSRSLTENGFTLRVRETAAVEVEDEESAIRMLKKDAERGGSDDTAMACNACLRVSIVLDREYILRHYDEAPTWFAQYGITVEDKKSASLKPAPKPRTAKAKQVKKSKAAEEPMEQEAA